MHRRTEGRELGALRLDVSHHFRRRTPRLPLAAALFVAVLSTLSAALVLAGRDPWGPSIVLLIAVLPPSPLRSCSLATTHGNWKEVDVMPQIHATVVGACYQVPAVDPPRVLAHCFMAMAVSYCPPLPSEHN